MGANQANSGRGGGDATCGRGFLSGTRKGPPSFSCLLFFPFFPFSPPLENRGRDPYGNVPGVGHTRYVPWAEEGNGGTFSQVTVLRDWDEKLDPGDCWVVSQGSTEQGLGVWGGVWPSPWLWAWPGLREDGPSSSLLSKWRGFPGFLWASGGGLALGVLAGGGCPLPARVAAAAATAAPPAVAPHPYSSPTLTQTLALRVHAPPPVLAASRLPNPPPASATRTAPSGPYWGHSPTSGPTR